MKKILIIGIILIVVVGIIIYSSANKQNPVDNNKVQPINGIWRAYGYIDTAYIEINEKLEFISYYATGMEENKGVVKEKGKRTFDLETSDGKYIMTIVFNEKYESLEIQGNTEKVSFIKDDGYAISENELIEKINVAIYMLNEVITEEFSLEYYDTYKKAAFTTEKPDTNKPDKLFAQDEDIPANLYQDELRKNISRSI